MFIGLCRLCLSGETPYSDCVSGEVTAMLSTGYRMPRPTHCPDMMYVALHHHFVISNVDNRHQVGRE